MSEEIDIYSKNGLYQLLNPSNIPENPFETGSSQSDEEKRGNTNEFARHPALTNSFADLTRLDQPIPVPGGKQPNQQPIPSHEQSIKAAQSVNPAADRTSIPGTGPDSDLMDQLLQVMISGSEMRLEFCKKVASLMSENTDIMQSIMGQLTQVFSRP